MVEEALGPDEQRRAAIAAANPELMALMPGFKEWLIAQGLRGLQLLQRPVQAAGGVLGNAVNPPPVMTHPTDPDWLTRLRAMSGRDTVASDQPAPPGPSFKDWLGEQVGSFERRPSAEQNLLSMPFMGATMPGAVPGAVRSAAAAARVSAPVSALEQGAGQAVRAPAMAVLGAVPGGGKPPRYGKGAKLNPGHGEDYVAPGEIGAKPPPPDERPLLADVDAMDIKRAMAKGLAANDKARERHVFGDRAQEYADASRMANSTNFIDQAKWDAAGRRVAEMEASLTDAQRAFLYGNTDVLPSGIPPSGAPPPPLETSSFAGRLRQAYDAVAAERAGLRTLRLTEAFKAMPDKPAGYTLQDFADELYRSHAGGDIGQAGLELHGPSSGVRREDILRAKVPGTNGERRYYAISAQELAAPNLQPPGGPPVGGGVPPAIQPPGGPPVGGGAPPAIQPPGGPPVGGGVPPGLPPTVGAVPSEVLRSLRQAEAMVAQDRPAPINANVNLVPGVAKARDLAMKARAWERPSLTTSRPIQVAQVAENSVKAELEQAMQVSRQDMLTMLDDRFGKGAVDGAKVNVRFLGIGADANPVAASHFNTLHDIFDRPSLYALTPEQKLAIQEFEARSEQWRTKINAGYGTDIKHFDALPGGAYLPDKDISTEAVAAEEAMRGVPGASVPGPSSMKPRDFQTAYDRMVADAAKVKAGTLGAKDAFVPQDSVRVLARGMDRMKANAAAGETFRAGVGGMPQQAWEHSQDPNLKPMGLGDGVLRYFSATDAARIGQMRERARNGWFGKVVNDIKGTAFGGDLSPLTQQGMQLAWADPVGFAKTLVTGKWAGSPERIADLVAADPQGWKDFAFATGRSLSQPTPGEYGTGWIGRVPKLGPALTEANSRMYNSVMTMAKNTFDADVAMFVKGGMSHDDAIAAAGDFIQKVVPAMNPSRYGLSPAQVEARSGILTSMSFLRKSGELLGDATRGYSKLLSGRPADMTTAERLGAVRVFRAAMMTSAIAVTSAVAEAKRTGSDPMQAVKDALDPNSPNFESLILFGQRAPLGGPFRALFKALADGATIGRPGRGLPRYVENRIHPVPAAGVGAALNRDRLPYGRQIYKDADDPYLKVGKAMLYLMEQSLPTTLSQVAGDATRGRQGMTAETAVQAVGQLGGQNISPVATPAPSGRTLPSGRARGRYLWGSRR